jgi:hypothetical protein
MVRMNILHLLRDRNRTAHPAPTAPFASTRNCKFNEIGSFGLSHPMRGYEAERTHKL